MSVVLSALVIGMIMGAFQIFAGWFLHLYRGRYKFGSFDEVRGVVATVILVGASITVAVLLVGDGDPPRSTPVIASGIALVMMLAGRFIVRYVRQSRQATHQGKPTIVVGAGNAAEQLVKAMLIDIERGIPLSQAEIEQSEEKEKLKDGESESDKKDKEEDSDGDSDEDDSEDDDSEDDKK